MHDKIGALYFFHQYPLMLRHRIVVGENFVLFMPTSYFLGPKSRQKARGLRKILRFCFPFPAAPKKLAGHPHGAFAPPMTFGSNSFWLHRPPTEQNRDFSKAAPVKDGWGLVIPRFCRVFKTAIPTKQTVTKTQTNQNGPKSRRDRA